MQQTTSDRIEHQILLSCASPENDVAAKARLNRLMLEELNWKYLLTAAEAHGMLPLLRKRLDEIDATPAALVSACFKNSMRSLALTGELLNIVSALAENGVDCVPFKGPVLAQLLFGNVGTRQFHDLDILVRLEDVKSAKEVLLSSGYELEFCLTPARENDYIRSEHALQFRKGECVVEIHWRFGSKSQRFPISAEDVWARLGTSKLLGRYIKTLSLDHLFLYLCMHGAKHSWERLEWICSLGMLVSHPGVNWPWVTATAQRTGAVRGLHLGLLLVHDICRTSLPPLIARAALEDRAARRLANLTRGRLFLSHERCNTHEFIRHKYYLCSRERLVDRLLIVILSSARIPHPLARDWQLFRLPTKFSFLYYLLRPMRLFREYGVRLLQG